jgi:hypothetical protein
MVGCGGNVYGCCVIAQCVIAQDVADAMRCPKTQHYDKPKSSYRDANVRQCDFDVLCHTN